MYYPALAATAITATLTEEYSPFEKWPPGVANIVAVYAECKVTLEPCPELRTVMGAVFSRNRDYSCGLRHTKLTVRTGLVIKKIPLAKRVTAMTLDSHDTLWIVYNDYLVVYLPYGATELLDLLAPQGYPFKVDMTPQPNPEPFIDAYIGNFDVWAVLRETVDSPPTFIYNVKTRLCRHTQGGETICLAVLPELVHCTDTNLVNDCLYINQPDETCTLVYNLTTNSKITHTHQRRLYGHGIDPNSNLIRTSRGNIYPPTIANVECMAPDGTSRTIYTYPGHLQIIGVTHTGTIIVWTNLDHNDMFQRLTFQ